MPIFKLSLVEADDDDDDAFLAEKVYEDFGQWTDARGFVVLAPDEATARSIAAVAASYSEAPSPWWLDEKVSRAEIVENDGIDRVVMGDWPTG